VDITAPRAASLIRMDAIDTAGVMVAWALPAACTVKPLAFRGTLGRSG